MRGLDYQNWTMRFVAGLNQKADDRSLEPPELAICRDAQFDELGGLQTRYPYAELGADIFGGGTIEDCRRIVVNGDELLCFTKSKLYSWSPGRSAWIDKGTHLAVHTEESTRFAGTGDQIACDRAQLSNTIVYCWQDENIGYVAALDATTLAVLMSPTAIVGSAARLRVTALSTRILLTFYDGINGLYAYALDPASPATAMGGASTTVTNSGFGEYYDVCRVAETDAAAFVARKSPTTSYTVGTITYSAGLTVATSTKARDAVGPVAIAVEPTGVTARIFRTTLFGGSTHSVVSDQITLSTLADVFTSTAMGTGGPLFIEGPGNQIAAAFRSEQDGGEYRCYMTVSANERTFPPALVFSSTYYFRAFTNYVDTADATGTGTSVGHLGVASRAFDHEGRVYVWLAFAEESRFGTGDSASFRAALQNTYFLYRDDGFLIAKASSGRAGGFSAVTSHLPNVQNISGSIYSWAGTERRVIEIGGNNHTGFGSRCPRDITVEFDSNEARRCARIGETLYVTGGEILQYDGQGLVECGFHLYPWYFEGEEDTAGANIPNGSYAFKATWRWENARGEIDRSTTATVGTVAIASGTSEVDLSIVPLYVTHKTGARKDAAIEIWRTLVDPLDDSPFYLVSSKDPAATGDNGYLKNNPALAVLATFTDDYADTTISSKETNPENGAILENLAPPPAALIAASQDRLFLGRVAGDPDRVWYSKLRSAGEVAAFHDALTVTIPAIGGDMTAIAFLNQTPVVFRGNEIYMLEGSGFDNAAGGSNYVARELGASVGAVNQESVVSTEKGLIFKSSKGWYLLTRGWSVEYVGGAVVDYDSWTPIAAHVVEEQHQVRILVQTYGVPGDDDLLGDVEAVLGFFSKMLVLDTLVGQWATWTVSDAVHACMWGGQHTSRTAWTWRRAGSSSPTSRASVACASSWCSASTAPSITYACVSRATTW